MGNMFSVVVEKRDAKTLIPIIRRLIRPGSIIISDLWKAYIRIEDIHEGHFYYYEHMTVNHSKTFKDPVTGAHTNTCEGAWSSQYKRHIPKQAFNKNALQGHLFARVWKRKYRKTLWKDMWRLLADLEYEPVVGATKKKSLK